MKRFIKIAGPLYVIFAILVAHSSLVTLEENSENSVGEGHVLVSSAPVVQPNQRLFRLNEGVDPYFPYTPPVIKPDKKHQYRIEAWTATWCAPCKQWQKQELPALLALGYEVQVRDVDTDEAPDCVEGVPTICVYRDGRILESKTYWRAEDIDKFIKESKA